MRSIAGGGDEVLSRDVEVAVVFHHAGVLDRRDADAVEPVEVLAGLEGCRQLEGAVAAEVEVDDGIAVFDRSDGLAVFGDHELLEVLIDDAGDFFAVGLDRFVRAREGAAFAEDVAVPAALDHRPVGVVAVHRDVHASAARGDFIVHAAGIEALEPSFEGIDIVEGGSFADVASVDQGVDARGLHAFFLGLLEHGLEVVDVRMDVAVRKKSDEMELAAGFFDIGDELFPGVAGEHRAGFEGGGHELRPLSEHASAADRIVADFAVSHVFVRGESDGGSVGLELRRGPVFLESGERLHVRFRDRIAFLVFTVADAVHDDEDDRTFPALPFRVFLERFDHAISP